MRFTDFSAFSFDPKRDVVLYLKPKHSWLWMLLAGGLLVVFAFFAAAASDPNWNPGRAPSKGAWVLALLLLLPAAVRAGLLVLFLGIFAEGYFRQTSRIFDRKPDFVIGPSGIADLNPWSPQAILWDDIVGITRALSGRSLFFPQTAVSLHFRAPDKRPRWIPTWLWKSLPAWITERHIVLFPEMLGMTEEEIFKIVERFGGRFPVEDEQPLS